MPLLRHRKSIKMNAFFINRKTAQNWADKWNFSIFDNKRVFFVRKANKKDFGFTPGQRDQYTVSKKKKISKFARAVKAEKAFVNFLRSTRKKTKNKRKNNPIKRRKKRKTKRRKK